MHRHAHVYLAALGLIFASGSARAIDEAHRVKGEAVAAKAAAYLKAQQDPKTGGWSIPPEGKGQPALPAISGLVLNGLLMHPGAKATDSEIAKGLDFILSMQKPDGGIYDTILPSYNTAICLSAVARADTPAAKAAIPKALEFLRRSQWGAEQPVGVGGAGGKESPTVVGPEHPFYGGLGYGNRGRPDISNLQFMIEAFHDCKVPADDPALQRAVVFLQRVQMLEKTPDGKVVNDQAYAKGSRQGGFIYATGENADTAGKGQSFATASTIEETLDDGTKVSKLRAYGSVTYAGFKSYVYAGLKQDDPRVKAAFDWISRHYTLEENPGVGTDGFYYYVIAFARALDARGPATLPVMVDGKPAERDWQNDLIDRLAQLQEPDGSLKVIDDRWMENNPVLITAYGLVALQHALRD